MTRSVSVPSIVKYCGCIRVMPGTFSYVLRQHVGDLVSWCIFCVSYMIGCVVKAANEKCDGGELVFGLYVGVAE